MLKAYKTDTYITVESSTITQHLHNFTFMLVNKIYNTLQLLFVVQDAIF